MPTRKSGLKHMRADEKKRLRNARVKSAVKTLMRKCESLIKKQDKEGAQKMYVRLSSALDKAAKRGIVHRNYSSRNKSRLAKGINAIKAR